MAADIDTGFIEKNQELLFIKDNIDLENCLALIAVYLILSESPTSNEPSPWQRKNAWRLNQPNKHNHEIIIGEQHFELNTQEHSSNANRVFEVHVNEQSFDVVATLNNEEINAEVNGHKQRAHIAKQGDSFTLFAEQGALSFELVKIDLGDANNESAQGDFSAPMNGTIVEIMVQPEEQVEQGSALLVMEAMKMQHTISAPSDGTVIELFCNQGDLVSGGDELLSFKAEK